MRSTTLWAFCLTILLFTTTSCSVYDRVAVWYKYRGDYRVHKTDTERLASKGRTTTPVATPTAEALPVEPAYASSVVETPVTTEAAATASATSAKALASAMSHRVTAKAPATSARPEKLTLKKAWQLKKAMKASGTSGSGKSQLVALLLCFFLGGLGIHRFYLGYIWQGVLQLLTLGGCGIWALIDLIRIIIGDLQPIDGSYSETL